MVKIMVDLADFNGFVRQYGSRVFLVAGRCFDLDPDNWEFMACAWYEKHSNMLEIPNDKYIGKLPGNKQEALRYHSVDELFQNPPKELVGVGKFIYEAWMARKKELAKMRNADPILPPPPVPPTPQPTPEDPASSRGKPAKLPPKNPDVKPPKKNPPPGLVRFSTYFGIAASLAAVVSWFVPGAKPLVVGIVAVIKAILSALGV